MALRSPDCFHASFVALVLGATNGIIGLWVVSQSGHVGFIGLVWGGIGLAATVAVPVYLLLRYTLITPMLIVAVFVRGFYVADRAPTTGEPFVGYVLLWPALVTGALVLAGFEYALRSQFGIFTPQLRGN